MVGESAGPGGSSLGRRVVVKVGCVSRWLYGGDAGGVFDKANW